MTTRSLLIENYNVSAELAEAIAKHGVTRTLAKNQILYCQDKQSETIALPLTGVLGVRSNKEDDNNHYYNVVAPGLMLNEVQYLLGGAMPTEVKATTPCRVVILPFSAVKHLIENYPEFSQVMNMCLAKKQRLAFTLFQLRGARNAEQKITRALDAIQDISQANTISMNIISIAAMLNMSRNTVGQIISSFIKDGKIKKDSRGLHLLPPGMPVDNSDNRMIH